MDAMQLEKDTYEPPVINSWRHSPTQAQRRYATDLCRSELPYAERASTIATFSALDVKGMSDLIDELKAVRARRLARLRRARRRR